MAERDPELAAEALPAMIKAAEMLAAASPGDRNARITVASLYLMYANAFLESEAFLLPPEEYERGVVLRHRAGALYHRALGILIPLVERRRPGLFNLGFQPVGAIETEAESSARAKALAVFGPRDLPLLYWSAAAVFASFASDPMDYDNSSRVPGAHALMERALELDPGWGAGMLHSLALSYYAGMPVELGGDPDRAETHYRVALEISVGRSASALVAYAESLCVPRGDYRGFVSALAGVAEIAAADDPANNLMNAIAAKRASRLLEDAPLLFGEAAGP